MRRKSDVLVPEWSHKIEDLRQARNLSQQSFGSRLGVSAMAVSRWERGAAEPTGDTYIRLGNLAESPLCWFFWRRAGLRRSDITRVLGADATRTQTRFLELNSANAKRKKHSLTKAGLVAIPLLPVHAGVAGMVGDGGDLSDISPEATLAAPQDWCPNPASTVCLRVKGDSMSPLILDGYIVAVDTSVTDNDQLLGRIVVAWHRERGLLISRLIRFDHVDALVSDHRDAEAVAVAAGSAWRIVGKVLWWTGRAR